MKITGTIINYYFHCKRQCWLFYNKLNMEDNSEEVRIGKVLHEMKADGKNTEILIDSIKVDKISSKYIIEIKKSDADVQAALWQLQYYMYCLNKKGIKRDGKLEIIEKNKDNKNIKIIEYDDELDKRVESLLEEIEGFLAGPMPINEVGKGCKKCSYYEYCYI